MKAAGHCIYTAELDRFKFSICMYTYICMYIYVYICIYVYMYIFMYAYMYICIYSYTYMFIHTYTRIQIPPTMLFTGQ